MDKAQKGYFVGGMILGVISLCLIGLYISDFINDKKLNVSSIMGTILLLVAWFNFITWGSDKKFQKDEMGRKVATMSAKTSYYILTVGLFILWFIDRIIFVRKNDFGNVSLFAAMCFSLVILPVVQFFSVRRYR